VGAEVIGVDLREPTSDVDFRSIYEAFLEYGVLVFREQPISPEQHVSFSRKFSPLSVHPIKELHLPGCPELIRLVGGGTMGPGDEPPGKAGELAWHTDPTFTSTPSIAALLHAIEIPPPEGGGDTAFVDLHRVYEALDSSIKRQIDQLRVVHSLISPSDDMAAVEDQGIDTVLDDTVAARFNEVVHPLVTIHPETGIKCLNISPSFTRRILGMSAERSAELLRELKLFAGRPEFVYVHSWRRFDIVGWDNRRTMHKAMGHSPRYRRVMHRTTFGGVFYAGQASAHVGGNVT